jgi:glycerol-3-phosphate acyltransferase PlsY
LLELGLKTLLAYLLGSVMGALLMGRLRGVDIRQLGSGNAGGTNALRTQGPGFAAGVILVDLGKAVVAVGLLPGWNIPGVGFDPDLARPWLVMACATGVVLGHVWPLYHDFRGGKGAATMAGAMAVMAPIVLGPVIAVWVVATAISGYVGLATMIAAFTLPLAVIILVKPLPLPLLVFALLVPLFIVFTHRANIARLRAGNENRMTRLWLFRPRGPGR